MLPGSSKRGSFRGNLFQNLLSLFISSSDFPCSRSWATTTSTLRASHRTGSESSTSKIASTAPPILCKIWELMNDGNLFRNFCCLPNEILQVTATPCTSDWKRSSVKCDLIQSGASYLLQGFEDNVLGSSTGWLADTVATYCPGRPSPLTWKNITISM